MNKFEQLIEYVINDEEDKARELFHEIVVEKSRNIYEELMAEEAEEELDEAKEEDDEEEVTESEHDEEEVAEGMMGGDQSDDLIDEIESEEEGVSMEADDEMDMEIDDESGFADEEEGDLEDRVVDLEDKLDELMAEFEAMMGGESGDMGDDEMDMDMGMDADMDIEQMDDEEMETESLGENISLKAAPKPTTSEEGGINKKSVVAANSGSKGAVAKPVHVTGETAQGRPAPTTKDAIGKVGNTPAQSTQKLTPAPKPTMSQASGVNTKSPL
jgi:hypothetical protein